MNAEGTVGVRKRVHGWIRRARIVVEAGWKTNIAGMRDGSEGRSEY